MRGRDPGALSLEVLGQARQYRHRAYLQLGDLVETAKTGTGSRVSRAASGGSGGEPPRSMAEREGPESARLGHS